MTLQIDRHVESLRQKIKHYLITSMGRSIEDADSKEFYRAFCYALREEIMINWAATSRTFDSEDARFIYYFSMEYLPGRLLSNNVRSLKSYELAAEVLKSMNRSHDEVALCEHDPGLGNGGLGRLAACFLDSLATQQYPAMGYGLRYQYGIFEQQLWDGVQMERPDCWLLTSNPWEFRRDQKATEVKFCGRAEEYRNKNRDVIYHLEDYETVRALPYDVPVVGYAQGHDFSVNTLRLWTTKESPRNFQMQRFNLGHIGSASENTTLTDVLYPNDNNDVGKRIRLKQEFLLVSSSLQDILRRYSRRYKDMSLFTEKVRIQINDTHPALTIAELMHLLVQEKEIPWKEALEMVRTCTSYTNHTILREALEQWNQNRMRMLLPRQYAIIERLNLEFCESIRVAFPGDEERVRRMSIIENGQVRMAHLSIVGSHKVNGVAALHTEILKNNVFKDFYELYPERFINVTNGVTQRRWLLHSNPALANFITERVGDGWVKQFSRISGIANFAADRESQQEFLRIKRENKERMIAFIHEYNSLRDIKGTIIPSHIEIDPDSLFDVQIKRFHEYKRQLLMALHLIILYHELKENSESREIKRVAIFGGKAAAGYRQAKNVVRLISAIARKVNGDKDIQNKLKVIFIENYNVSKAEIIIPSADVSEQISTAGMEASGTGNMKLAINGALTVGTDDGANIEMRQEVKDQWWPFCFGNSEEENNRLREEGSYDPWSVLGDHPSIGKAVEALRDRSFANSDDEHRAFHEIYDSLLKGGGDFGADKYFVLLDLVSYYEVQKEVEKLFLNKEKWAEYALHNIAGMGKFSSDVSVENYAQKIWGINRCPLNQEILDRVREEFEEHDKCTPIPYEETKKTSRNSGFFGRFF